MMALSLLKETLSKNNRNVNGGKRDAGFCHMSKNNFIDFAQTLLVPIGLCQIFYFFSCFSFLRR